MNLDKLILLEIIAQQQAEIKKLKQEIDKRDFTMISVTIVYFLIMF